MLRADAFAPAAGDTRVRGTEALRQTGVVGKVDRPALLFQILAHILIVQGKVPGNRDAHRAAFKGLLDFYVNEGDYIEYAISMGEPVVTIYLK